MVNVRSRTGAFLPDQLVEPLLGHRAGAVGVDVDAGDRRLAPGRRA